MFKEVGGHACDECERAKAKRVHLTGSAGLQSDANSTVAIDDWEVSVGHIHGGQKVVGGAAHADDLTAAFRELEAMPAGAAEQTVFGEALGFSPEVLQQTLDLEASL